MMVRDGVSETSWEFNKTTRALRRTKTAWRELRRTKTAWMELRTRTTGRKSSRQRTVGIEPLGWPVSLGPIRLRRRGSSTTGTGHRTRRTGRRTTRTGRRTMRTVRRTTRTGIRTIRSSGTRLWARSVWSVRAAVRRRTGLRRWTVPGRRARSCRRTSIRCRLTSIRCRRTSIRYLRSSIRWNLRRYLLSCIRCRLTSIRLRSSNRPKNSLRTMVGCNCLAARRWPWRTRRSRNTEIQLRTSDYYGVVQDGIRSRNIVSFKLHRFGFQRRHFFKRLLRVPNWLSMNISSSTKRFNRSANEIKYLTPDHIVLFCVQSKTFI